MSEQITMRISNIKKHEDIAFKVVVTIASVGIVSMGILIFGYGLILASL